MDDYISRQTIIEAVHSAMYPYFCGAEDGDALSEDEKLVLSVNKTICTAIKALPSADVQPVRHGHWIDFDDARISGKCSVCGWEAHLYEDDVVGMPCCPNCGATMDSDRNDIR